MSSQPMDLEALRAELVGLRVREIGVDTPERVRHSGSSAHASTGGAGEKRVSNARLARIELHKEELIRYLVAGYTVKEIGQLLAMHPMTLHMYMKTDPTVVERVRAKSAEVGARIEEELFKGRRAFNERLTAAADDALEEMERLLVEGDDRIKLKAAQDLLDRDGRAPRTARTEGKHFIVNIDADMIRLAQEAAREDEARGRG